MELVIRKETAADVEAIRKVKECLLEKQDAQE